MGCLHDFDRIDDVGFEVRAGCNGYIVAQAWSARVNRGQNLLCVGKPL